jgi:hypothetical protein
LKAIAKARLNDSKALLQRWWTNKYKMPPTSRDYLAYTEDELWVEFYEDYYHAKPDHAIEEIDKNGTVQFVTGDPEMDELEKRIAEGTISDEEIQQVLAGWESGKPIADAALVTGVEDDPDFDDDYVKG